MKIKTKICKSMRYSKKSIEGEGTIDVIFCMKLPYIRENI